MLGTVPCRLCLLLLAVLTMCPVETGAAVDCPSTFFFDNDTMSCVPECPGELVGDHITGRCETFDVAMSHYSTGSMSYTTVSGTTVAFNATSYSAIIPQDIPPEAVILSVGLIVDWTETYSLSARQNNNNPTNPFDIIVDGDRRGEVHVRDVFNDVLVTVSDYKYSVTCLFSSTRISANVDITVVSETLVTLMSAPTPTNVLEGQVLQLECSYTFNTANTFATYWYQDGEKLLNGTVIGSSPIVVSSNDSHSVLRQEKAALDLNGTHFACGFESSYFPGGSLTSDSALVLVEQLGKPNTPTGLSADVGTTVATVTWAENPVAVNYYHLQLYFENVTVVHNYTFPNTTLMVQLSNLTDGTWYTVTLVAENGLGRSQAASVSFQTDIDECTLGTSGCEQTCTNLMPSYMCGCYNGYTLSSDQHNCTDIDECVGDEHNCSQLCENVPGSFECKCDGGYSLQDDGVKCTDVDECQTGAHNCSHSCTNAIGSFECKCDDGYSLQGDGANCSDVDECDTGAHKCSQICSNTLGSFECKCDDGYMLTSDNATCTDVDECQTGAHNCSHSCSNTFGSFECMCDDGYSLDFDNATCTDVDECQTGAHSCHQICSNTLGSFECMCADGYFLDSDDATCTDVDECVVNEHNCSQLCENIAGSFECKCDGGYSLQDDGVNCADVDECQTGAHSCHQICSNTHGSFECKCDDGYTLTSDNASCTDVDECETDAHSCSHSCSNTIGSFECKCDTGYSLDSDNATCTDIDECVGNEHNCSQLCENVPGSFECKCTAGYSLLDDGVNCTDVDECDTGAHKCSHSCSNTLGSFKCNCDAGYMLTSDNASCTDVDECQTDAHKCSHNCANTIGSFQCKCNDGFFLNPDKTTCTELRGADDIINLSTKLNQSLTAENADELLNASLLVAVTLDGAVSVANSNSSEETEELLGAVTEVLSSIVDIRTATKNNFNASLPPEEEEELNVALVGTLGQVLSDDFLSSLSGNNETNQSKAVTDLVSVAEEIGVSVASGLGQGRLSKNYTQGNLTLQVGLPSNDSFQAVVGQDITVNIFAESLTLSTGEPLAVVTMALGSVGNFFPSNRTFEVLGEVISIQLASTVNISAETLRSDSNDSYPVQMNFPTIVDSENVTCGFYVFGTDGTAAGWSEEGVVKRNCSGGVCCHSNHLTNFAVLVNIGGVKHTDAVELALEILSYIGCCLSIICLFITIIALSVFRYKGQKTPLNFVHLNLSVVLFVALCLFIGGSWYLRYHEIPCAIVAGLLHYLFLAVFSWMLCEGVMLYLMLVKVFTQLPQKLWFFALLGYGLPILPVVVTVGARYEFYGSVEFGCWLSPKLEDRTIWGFVIPIAMIMIINAVFLVMVIVQVCKSQKSSAARDSSNPKVAVKTVKATVLLLPLLGLTWIFGFVTFPSLTAAPTIAFQVIFIVLNSLQGVAIFIFYVLRNDSMLPVWKKWCPCYKKFDSDSRPTASKSSTLQLGKFSTQQVSIAMDTKVEDLDDMSIKSKGYDSSSITDTNVEPSINHAEEQAVAVDFADGTDAASITDCEFHIKEGIISSSAAMQCNEKSELT